MSFWAGGNVVAIGSIKPTAVNKLYILCGIASLNIQKAVIAKEEINKCNLDNKHPEFI